MAELNPIKRIVSKLDNKLTYDNILQDGSLLNDDKEYESNLHYISIFGKTYLICMGKMYRHEENENIRFHIVYLMYDDKVVTRLGVYEYNIIDIKNQENIDFSLLDLIIKEEYYTNIESLELYSIDDKKLQDIISSSEKISEESKDVVEEEGEEKEDGEISEDEEEIFDGEDNIHEVFHNITNGGKDITNIKNISPSTIYYYIKELSNHITDTQNQEIINKYINKHVLPIEKSGKLKVVKSKMNILIEQKSLNYSNIMLNLLEYMLNIKIITISEDEDKDDEYGDFSLYEKKDIKFNFDENKHKKTINMYNNYKPTKFMFIKIKDGEDGNNQYSVYTLNGKHMINYNEMEEDMKDTIKELYNLSGNEYSKESNTHFKQLFKIE